MGKKIILLSLFVFFLNICTAAPTTPLPKNQILVDKLNKIVTMSRQVKQRALPVPYNYLLTQTLMTLSIEKYYQRTAITHVVFAKKNQKDNTYFRIIILLVDSNKTRNDSKQALEMNEQLPVELALIKINFNQLPKKLIHDVLHSNIPFGKLLIKNHVDILSNNRRYFSTYCDKTLVSLIHCNLNSKLYGRSNTLLRADNKKWVARVIEILPAS